MLEFRICIPKLLNLCKEGERLPIYAIPPVRVLNVHSPTCVAHSARHRSHTPVTCSCLRLRPSIFNRRPPNYRVSTAGEEQGWFVVRAFMKQVRS